MKKDKEQKDLNKLEERIILEDLSQTLDSDTLKITNKVSDLFDNLEVEETGTIEISEAISYVLNEYDVENADEILEKIIVELKNKGII